MENQLSINLSSFSKGLQLAIKKDLSFKNSNTEELRRILRNPTKVGAFQAAKNWILNNDYDLKQPHISLIIDLLIQALLAEGPSRSAEDEEWLSQARGANPTQPWYWR